MKKKYLSKSTIYLTKSTLHDILSSTGQLPGERFDYLYTVSELYDLTHTLAGEYLAGCGVFVFPHGQAPIMDAQQKTQRHNAGNQLSEHSLLHISYLLSEWIVLGLCVQYNVCRAGRPIPGGFTQNFRGF